MILLVILQSAITVILPILSSTASTTDLSLSRILITLQSTPCQKLLNIKAKMLDKTDRDKETSTVIPMLKI